MASRHTGCLVYTPHGSYCLAMRRALTTVVGLASAATLVLSMVTADGAGAVHRIPTKAESVKVTECSTVYGAGRPPPGHGGKTEHITVPSTVVGKVGLYTDARRTVEPLLGPKGWSCDAVVGADGSVSLTLAATRSLLRHRSASVGSKTASGGPGIHASTNGGCQGCMALQVCGLFPSDLAALGAAGTTCRSTPPRRETDTEVAGSPSAGYGTVAFIDPPNVKGTGTGSGGRDRALGVVTASGNPNGSGGSDAVVSCVLPRADYSLCASVVQRFVVTNWGIGSAPTPITATPAPTS